MPETPSSRRVDRGAALPGVLVVMLWLTGITGWLVAHTTWEQRVAQVDDLTLALGFAADAMGEVMTRELGYIADWQAAVAPGPALPCPAGGPGLPPQVDGPAETARLQAATDALARWAPGSAPIWRHLAACDAAALAGGWRGPTPAPWLLAWVADVPDAGAVAASPAQVMLHVVAVFPGRGRAARTLTVRRYPGETWGRIVAWRAG